MALTKELIRNYTTILKEELLPAMGCTEPIAIAYAAAKARQVLGGMPDQVRIICSGNMIKNVKGVTVPNSGGQKGIETAAVLGIVGGDADKELEVIAGVDDEARAKTRELVKAGICDVELAEDVPNLYIRAELKNAEHSAAVVIAEHHTEITQIEKDGKVVFHQDLAQETKTEGPRGDRSLMTLAGILEYAETVDLSEVKDVISQQIRLNTAISQEGLDNPWGARVGKTILENWGDDAKDIACARAAAGSDARMSGCPLPVIINSGSGNQGITVTMPVITFAEKWHVSEEKLYRSLLVSNLVSVYIKHYIGALSAFCGAVSAGCGAGAAITWMSGGTYEEVGGTITNTLGNVGGIVCDGAKPSCAAKIASSVHAAILAHYMSTSNKEFRGGEGFVENDVEDTIRNMGYIGKIGMKETDKEILNVMIDKVDVKSCL